MTYREGEWDAALDAIAHGVHARHGRELHFSELIAREIFATARMLGIPTEDIHNWAAKREQMLRREAGGLAGEPGDAAGTRLDLGLLKDYRAGVPPGSAQN